VKEKIFILSFFLHALSASIACAQTKTIDSLKSLLKESRQDSTQANLLNALSREYYKIDEYDSVYNFTQKAAELSKQINHPKGEARAYRDLGWYYIYKNNYKTGMEYANKAMQLYRNINYKNGEGLVFLLMATLHLFRESMIVHDTSLTMHLRFLKIRTISQVAQMQFLHWAICIT
jgi:tetratricopeptide (TPR) repeat protein